MADCLRLLAGSADVDADRLTFLLTQFAFWLLAATDGHAKNYSVFLGRGDAYTMTPLNDVLSVWPYIGDAPNRFRWRSAGLAMAVRSKNTRSPRACWLMCSDFVADSRERHRADGISRPARAVSFGNEQPSHRRLAPSGAGTRPFGPARLAGR